MTDLSFSPVRDLGGRRNLVRLVRLRNPDLPELAVLKDFEDRDEACRRELSLHRHLEYEGLLVPRLLRQEGTRLLYEYVEGPTLLELLERLEQTPGDPSILASFDELSLWLERFYRCSRGIILGDLHLRNFILGDRGVCGLDLECSAPGHPETDLSWLMMMIVLYDPPHTAVKEDLAQRLCRSLKLSVPLDMKLLREEMDRQTAVLEQRRGISVDRRRLHSLFFA